MFYTKKFYVCALDGVLIKCQSLVFAHINNNDRNLNTLGSCDRAS